MKYLFLRAGIFSLAIISILASCTNPPKKDHSNKAVYIGFSKGKYILYRNKKPFFIKGAAGYTNLKKLKEAGGNTIRTWDTVRLDSIIKNADAHGVAIIIGLPMPYNDNMDAFYKNDAKVEALFIRYRAIINKYKGHPAVLAWCLGNEVAFPLKPQYNKFYTVYNRFVDMIHHDDPDHPVTTTTINFKRKYMLSITLRTDIDFISLNIFGAIKTLKTDLQDFAWIWNGPFMITEWGIDGPWAGSVQTAWGAYIESTSNKKAEQYLNIYQKYMPVNSPGFLGSSVFYWGQKQETTFTWFSMFDKNGNMTASVNVMQYLWTGTWPQHHPPNINYMLVDGKGALDNLIYKPNVIVNANVLMIDSTGNKDLRYEWQIQPEDWFRVQHVYNQKAKKPLPHLIISESGEGVSFRTPLKEGPYRIFVSVYDKNGYFATTNTPFYVVDMNN
ncbi:glycoside hydrolase family 2 TIM barrel-domain containing protein [Mucilaginibacter sp.]|uniref:glycoside hydrolase family 2 TIM barrel-domain containing protein n=1 Tax=Mucilaginibacter sp. TaxID=1882438 RepID=UPI00356A5841